MRRSTQIQILVTLTVTFAVAVLSALVYGLPLRLPAPLWSWPLFGPGLLASYAFAGKEGWPSVGAMVVTCGLVNGATWATVVSVVWRPRAVPESVSMVRPLSTDSTTTEAPNLAA